MQFSVVIPTHDPRLDYLARVLTALRAQTLPCDQWELVVVDNASSSPLASHLDLTWHPHGRVIREEHLGLTLARLAGFGAASGDVIVLVDDDNVLAPDFLAQALTIKQTYPKLGAWSGNVVLEFEPGAIPPPPEWRGTLTERYVTQSSISSDRHHHESTPWGAGLCVCREVFSAYAAELAANPLRRQLDLHGQTLMYGGDTDIAYVGCAHNYTKGVFVQLLVTHLIPARRCDTAYLLRSIEGHAYSSVLHEFILSGAIPAYLSSPVWRTRQWLRRIALPRAARLEATARACGYARAVRTIRQVATTP